MPVSAKRPCSTFGCPHTQPCADHPKPQGRWGGRGTSSERGYGAEWQRARQHALMRDGYQCVECGGTERLSVDHVIPRQQGGSDDLSNLRTLDGRCHDRKTGQEGQARR